MSHGTNNLKPAWDAYIAPTERIMLDQADGRIAASIIRQYPPGVPDIIPGMRYSAQIIDDMEKAHARGIDIIGVDMDNDRQVEVLVQTETETGRPDIQTFDAQSISDSTANEIADYFRTGFTAAPYFHFAFHESDPLQSLPHTLDFDAYIVSTALSDPEKRRACQEALLESAYQRALQLTDKIDLKSIILPNGFYLWTDKELCRKHMKDRLSDPGYVTLVRCSETAKLQGLLHARAGTVNRIFETEEWSNPLRFSRYSDASVKDDPERFYKKIEYHFGLQVSQALFPFVSKKIYWHHRVKKRVRNKRIYEKKFYIPLPTDCSRLTVRPNGKLGLAVFATDDIPANTRIAVFTGETYQSDTALGLPEIMRDHAIQIGSNEYVYGYKGLAHCLCHSCHPNCGIRNFTEIFTIRDILKGEQLSWDYRCSENSNWVLEECLCNTARCTGRVGNFDSLPPNLKTEYLSKSMVSEWILSKLSN